MNTAEASGGTRELERIWLIIPAVWLLVGIAGFVAISHWPEVFAEPRLANIPLAPNAGRTQPTPADTGVNAVVVPFPSTISTSSDEFHFAER